MVLMRSTGSVGKLVFTFPGQGSFHANILSELFERDAYRPQFDAADRITRRILGQPFLPLTQGATPAYPDLDQVGIYVTEFLLADLLISSGVQPHLLLG